LYERIADQRSGLAEERILETLHGENAKVTGSHVSEALVSIKPLLQGRLGKDLCGALAENVSTRR
jgi:hypothetical protein